MPGVALHPTLQNVQHTAYISAAGSLWLQGRHYYFPDTGVYPASAASLVSVPVAGCYVGIPSNLWVLTSRGYVLVPDLIDGDELLLMLTPVDGVEPVTGIPFTVTQRQLVLRVMGAPTTQGPMFVASAGTAGSSLVTWTPMIGVPVPNTAGTPPESIACLCLLNYNPTCTDVQSFEVTWTQV